MGKSNISFTRFIVSVMLLNGVPSVFSQSTPSTLSKSDATFLEEAAQGGMDEVKLGELAQQNAASDSVKTFGKHMVDDHSKMNDQLKALASRKNVSIPSHISLKQKASNRLLSAKKGSSFDKAYMADMVEDHKKDVEAFEKEASSGSDADVKALASNALPTLRAHLKMAEDIAKQVGANK